MNIPTDKEVEEVRAAYPSGTRIQLVEMDDAQAPPIGTKGTVICVDDIGSLLVKWDNGSGMSVAYGKDKVLILDTECCYCAIDEKGHSIAEPLVSDEAQVFYSTISIDQTIEDEGAEIFIGVGHKRFYTSRRKWKYCPMCGRKLEGGADCGKT